MQREECRRVLPVLDTFGGRSFKGVPPVHKGQRFPIADAFAPLDRIQKLRDAFYQILPPADAIRDPQPQPDTAIVRRKLRFQQSKVQRRAGYAVRPQVVGRGAGDRL